MLIALTAVATGEQPPMLSAQTAAPESFRRQVLSPYNPREACGVAEAALRAGVCVQTVRTWCDVHGIGRIVAGRFKISRPALEMLLADDRQAMSLYHVGQRADPRVQAYFRRCGIAGAPAK